MKFKKMHSRKRRLFFLGISFLFIFQGLSGHSMLNAQGFAPPTTDSRTSGRLDRRDAPTRPADAPPRLHTAAAREVIYLPDQELRSRLVNSFWIGRFAGYRHSSRVITLSEDEYNQLLPDLSEIQKRKFTESFEKYGERVIIASFFNREVLLPDGTVKNILRIEYNNSTDSRNATRFVAKIAPNGSNDHESKIRFLKSTFQALKKYEPNQIRVRYSAMRVGANVGNCNSAQNTLNKAAGGYFENLESVPSGLLNINRLFSVGHFGVGTGNVSESSNNARN